MEKNICKKVENREDDTTLFQKDPGYKPVCKSYETISFPYPPADQADTWWKFLSEDKYTNSLPQFLADAGYTDFFIFTKIYM